MRRFILTVAMAAAVCLAPEACAQEHENDGWKWVPGVSFVRHFPGNTIERVPDVRTFDGPPGVEPYRYESYGGQLTVRGYSPSLAPFVVTFGAGLHWFSRSGTSAIYGIHPVDAGIGRQLAPGDFTVFPVSAGLQYVYPPHPNGNVGLFIGGEGQMVFVDGNVDMNQQVKGGYVLSAGFSVRAFEFGVRYAAFSDLRNLGIQLGLRFRSLSF